MLSLTLMQIIILFFIFLQLFRFFRLSLISLHSLQIIRFFARWQFACENVKALLDKIIHNILTKVPKKKMISLFFCSTLPSINFIITLIACVDIFCFILCSIWVFFLAYCDWNGSDVDMTVGLELIKKTTHECLIMGFCYCLSPLFVNFESESHYDNVKLVINEVQSSYDRSHWHGHRSTKWKTKSSEWTTKNSTRLYAPVKAKPFPANW